MKTRAWRKVFAISLGAALFAAGCVISSDDDDDGTGGSSGSSGSSGKGGTGGTGGTSGTGGTGGTGGHVYTCSEQPDAGNVDCVQCLHQNCCAEFLTCANDDKSTPCWGNTGEFFCITNCIVDLFNDPDGGGAVSEDQKAECVASCKKGSTPSQATNDLFACANSGERADGGKGKDCAVDCFGN